MSERCDAGDSDSRILSRGFDVGEGRAGIKFFDAGFSGRREREILCWLDGFLVRHVKRFFVEGLLDLPGDLGTDF